MIIQLLKFIFFLIFFVYLPSRLIFRFIKIEKLDNFFIHLCISLVFGLIQLTLIILLLRSVNLPFQILWFLPIISLVYLFFTKNSIIQFLKSVKLELKGNLLLVFILLMGIFTQNLVMYRGGILVGNDYLFPSAHDTMWSLAIMQELTFSFPPQNPGFSGIILKNHHFFYPLLLASVQKITGIDSFDIYFRFMPVLISLLFGLSIYCVSTIFIKSNTYRILSVILGYFSGNFAYLVPLFKGPSFDWRGNTFFADQPFDQIINPYSVLGFIIFLGIIFMLFKSIKHEKQVALNWFLLSSVSAGSLYGFKSFGGIVSIISFIVISLVLFIKLKKLQVLLISLIGLSIFFYTFFLITDINTASLRFAPGWILTEILATDKLDVPYWVSVESYYQAVGNTLGLLKIKLMTFIIYLAGNLGVRLLGLWFIIRYAFDYFKLKSGLKYAFLFSFVGSTLSFMIPVLFNLGSNAYNVIQFTPYSLIIFAIFSAAFCEKISVKYTLFKNKVAATLLILLVTLLAVPVNIKNILGKIPLSGDLISEDEVESLHFLTKNSSSKDLVLINPDQFKLDPIYVPAISSRRIYLASPGYARQTGINPQKRQNEIKLFFGNPEVEMLRRNNIKFIYLRKTDTSMDMVNKFGNLGFKIIFENDKAVILAVKTLYV